MAETLVELAKHLELLGRRVEERVTGFTGTVTSIRFDLYGCIQGAVMPKTTDPGKIPDGHWFDVARLKTTSLRRVIKVSYEYSPSGLKDLLDKYLGSEVRECLTRYEGSVVSIYFALTEKASVSITPKMRPDGTLGDNVNFPLTGVKIISDKKLMEHPYNTEEVAKGRRGSIRNAPPVH